MLKSLQRLSKLCYHTRLKLVPVIPLFNKAYKYTLYPDQGLCRDMDDRAVADGDPLILRRNLYLSSLT